MTNVIKKPFLVDVPVKTTIWIRRECQRLQFEVIKKARPSILFVQSDGGRNEIEWAAIKENRMIFDTEIDWDCKVYKIYSDHNLGMYAMAEKTSNYIWEIVDRCIFMEDDDVPSVSFFSFCSTLFEKYKNDKRVYAICGMNHIGINNECQYDYFFSRYGSIWGVGYWKRSFEQNKLDFVNDVYYQRLLKMATKKHPTHWKQIKSIIKHGSYDNHKPATEFFMNLSIYANNQVLIIPKKNMISQIGFGKDSAHSDSLELLPKTIRNIFNMSTYELELPIKHPTFMIPDYEYEKKRNRIQALDHPIINRIRRIKRGLLVLKNGDIKWLFKKMKRKRWEN